MSSGALPMGETGILPVHRLEAGATQCRRQWMVVPAREPHLLTDFWVELNNPGGEFSLVRSTM